MRDIAYSNSLVLPRQPEDGHHGPKHVVVSQYIITKILHLSDSCVRLPTLPKVLTRTTGMTQFLGIIVCTMK